MPAIFKRLLQPSIVIGTTVVIAIAAVVIAYIYTNQKPVESYITPTTGPIVEEVDTTGSVKAADTLDLAFQVGGKISYAGPAVGAHVGQGATLVTLASADLEASLEQAQAALQVQEANLVSIQAGARPEDVAVSQTAVAGAQSAVLQSKESVIQTAQDAYEKSDDAIHNKVDQFINNPRTATPTLAFNLSDSQSQSAIVSGRVSMEALLSSWQEYLAGLPSDPDQVDTEMLASTTRSNLQQVSSYLDTVASGLTEVIPTTSYPTATIQGYETNVTAARANISIDVSAINAAETGEKSAESGLASAQSQLVLKQAGATPEALQAQEAQVAAAQANVDAAKAQLAKTVIAAPISGTITVNNAHAGEIASAGAIEVSMISDSQFQFETYVSEADLSKVQVGQVAQVELDAYESQPALSTHVVAIDPAATVSGGISSYKVTLQFDQNDPRIQAGLTGSVKIIAQSKNSVLSVPTSAIITRGTDHFVLRKTPGGDAEVQVQTGIASASGMTEITSGLTQADEIRSFGSQQ